MDTQLSSFQLE